MRTNRSAFLFPCSLCSMNTYIYIWTLIYITWPYFYFIGGGRLSQKPNQSQLNPGKIRFFKSHNWILNRLESYCFFSNHCHNWKMFSSLCLYVCICVYSLRLRCLKPIIPWREVHHATSIRTSAARSCRCNWKCSSCQWQKVTTASSETNENVSFILLVDLSAINTPNWCYFWYMYH